MATLELSRSLAVSYHNQVRREETPSPLIAAGVGSHLFPSVPTHTPSYGTDRQDDAGNLIGRGGYALTLNREEQRMVEDQAEEEEMEEVLEELQDDEMEELADSTDISSQESTLDTVGQDEETLPLLNTALQSIESLIAVLEQTPPQTPAVEGDLSDNSRFLTSLMDLLISLQAARKTADVLDSQVSRLQRKDVVSPLTTQAPPVPPKDIPLSQPIQQNRAQRLHDLIRQGATSSPLILSSPLKSREELRNPFRDVATRSQIVTSDERLRSRIDREVEGLSRLAKTLRGVDKRCVEVIANLEAINSLESKAKVTEQNKDEMLKTWSQLYATSKATQKRIARRSTSLFSLDIRKGSHSPTAYSPTYTPSRSRSRRNSNTSIRSASTSLHSIDAGDSVGEATAAGVGVGITRSLSRLSSLSSRTGSSSVLILPPASTTYMTGSPHARRESTRSDGGSIQSAPPRYSEDSARKWSENVLGASREAEASEQRRQRWESGGEMSDIALRALPAYNSTDLAYHKMSSSTSSLNKLDHSITFPQDEKKGSRTAGDDASGVSQHQATLQNATSAEYSDRTSQDLRMVETSIERLYSAVPQLNNQRACSPTEKKRRQSQDVQLLIDQLTKSGRMEDQRAVLPEETPHRVASVAASPEAHSDAIASPLSTAPLPNKRLARRLGSISFGKSLSLRLASSVLGSDVKGKEKEKSSLSSDALYGSSPTSPRAATLEDLLPLANQVHAASERGFNDQRAQIRTRPINKKKPYKLDLMGVSVSRKVESRVVTSLADPDCDDQTNKGTAELEDDSFLDALAASMSDSRRMADQEAIMRPLSAKRSISQPSSAAVQCFTLSPGTATSSRTEQNYAFRTSSSPIGNTLDGECKGTDLPRPGNDADASNRDVCIDGGIKANGDFIASLCYISESQPRLGCISAQIWNKSTAPSSVTDTLEHRIDGDSGRTLSITYGKSTSSYLLPTPAMSNQDGQSVTRLPDHWQIKLQMSGILQRELREAPAPLSAYILQKDLPTAFVCNVCLSVVAETEAITRYLPLPSQHWEELIDAWMCHSDQEINQGMVDTQKKLDEHRDLQIGQGRVSDAGVVMHASHVSRGATLLEETNYRLRCTRCKSTLGQEASSGAIELFKYAIRPKMALQSLPASMLGMVVANDLIRLSQAHATRHFLLRDNEDESTYLHLWLFLESFQIAVNLPTSFTICGMESKDSADTSASLPACKIMYRQASSKDSSSPSHTAWAQPDIVENIQYPKEVCHQLRDLLHASTLCYPPSRRVFAADWTIGFLQTSSSITTL